MEVAKVIGIGSKSRK